MPNLIHDISTLPAEVQTLLNENPEIFVQYMTEGMPWINKHFTVIQSDEHTALWNLEVLDFLRPASDDWDPVQALNLKAKIPKFEDLDGDLEIPRSQIINMARSHVKRVANAGSLKDVLGNNNFAYSFLTMLAGRVGSLLETKGVFTGVRSSTPGVKGTNFSLNGMNYRITQGVASGDIPSGNVYTSPGGTYTAAQAYTEVREICQKTEGKPEIAGKPMDYFLSQTAYRLYNEGRRAANSNTIGPNDRPQTVDDFDNIRFVITPGLTGSLKQFINTKANQFIGFPEDFVQAPLVTLIPDTKVYKANIFTSAWVGYNYGPLVFTNTRA